MTETLSEALETVPTIRFGRERRTHGYKLHIEGPNIRVYTRCGLPTLGAIYTMTHGVITCDDCTEERS